MPQKPRIILSAAIMLCATQVLADDRDMKMANLFDKPLATQTVLAMSDAEEGNELRCTYYKDLLIREKGTDTPAPGAAVIIPVTRAAGRPPCKTAKGGEIPLQTENYSLVGRKGDYLVFQATDPNGSVPFVVINATSGKTIYTGGMVEDQMRSVTLANGVLHLKYTSGANGSCSLLSGGKTCWDKMVAEGTVPAEVAQAPLPTQACTESYRKDKTPSDDPSVVTFDVDMTLDLSGKMNVISRGKVGCAPMP
jgi:hypothetical protein